MGEPDLYDGPELSRDGKWIAYVTGESGHDEVHVGPFSVHAPLPEAKPRPIVLVPNWKEGPER